MLLHGAFVMLSLLSLSLCAEDFYRLLQLERTASERDIKKAYRTLSKRYHPDKNAGDEEAHKKFVEIAEAYEALHDPETRRIYDQYGHDGLAQHKSGGGRPHGDAFDLFSRFFGGSGHFGHGGGERRGPDMEVRVHVPLRDFYNGREHDFSVEKQQICDECEGSGSADGRLEPCPHCAGRGVVVQKHMLAPGFFQQIQRPCDHCNGQGTTVAHPCPACAGARVVRRLATHRLHVEKGMPRESRIVYENEADESPDWVAGDLLIYIMEADPILGAADEHRVDGTFFRRKGRDLYWKEVLSLREAWMGDWTRNLTHLDGHVVQLSRKRGETVQPNTVEIIEEEGMPLWSGHREHSSEEFGHLHVEYAVVLPDMMEQPMEKEFWSVWEKWRKKKAVNLEQDSGRPEASMRDEL